MNHSYFLVSLDLDRNGHTLWEHEVKQFWRKIEDDHSLLGDPQRLILNDAELSTLLKYDRLGFMVEEFDSNVSNSLWAEYAADDGGPAQLTRRYFLDKDPIGDWQIVDENQTGANRSRVG